MATANFQSLPGLTLAEVASFLDDERRDILASTCRWAVACPEFAPTSRVLTRRIRNMRELIRASPALGRLLSVRGGGACKELMVKDTWAIRALELAAREGHGARLTSLSVDGSDEDNMRGRACAVQLSLVLRLLPGLRYLQVISALEEERHWALIWEKLRLGACPDLDGLVAIIDTDVPPPSPTIGLGMPLLMETLRERAASGCEPLRLLSLGTGPYEMPFGLDALGPALPEQVGLHLVLSESQMNDLVPCFGQLVDRPRWLVSVMVTGVDPENGALDPDGSGMVTALAESGLVRGLQQLQLIKMTLKPAALDALAAAISSTPPEELLLEGLTLWQINLEDQEALISCAKLVAAALSSCPRLIELRLVTNWSFGQELPVPAPTFLSPLRTLMTNTSLVPFWAHQAGQPLASLQHLDIGPLDPEFVHGVITDLAQALPAMPNLRTLEIDADLHPQGGGEEGCIGLLADAFKAGAIRELRSLDLRWSATGYAVMLQALAEDTCPYLEVLRFREPKGRHEREALSLDGQLALRRLVRGRQGRSASLAVLDVEQAFTLNSLGLMTLGRALAEETGARLESLSLSYRPLEPPIGKPGRRLHMVDSLVAALEQPRAGSRLDTLRLHIFSRGCCEERFSEADLEPLVDRLYDALEGGAWPCMPASRGPVLMCDRSYHFDINLQQADDHDQAQPTAELPGADKEADLGHAGDSGPEAERRPLSGRDILALVLPPVLMLTVVWYRMRALQARA